MAPHTGSCRSELEGRAQLQCVGIEDSQDAFVYKHALKITNFQWGVCVFNI